MKIELIVLGNLKEKYWKDAMDEYSKRLSRFCKLTITEIKEVPVHDEHSQALIEKALDSEADKVLSKIQTSDYVIALAIKGKELTSEAFAKKLEQISFSHKKIVFVIGSSHGLSQRIETRAQLNLSFSAFTFPHQLARVILIEQIYRGYKILANEAYHK